LDTDGRNFSAILDQRTGHSAHGYVGTVPTDMWAQTLLAMGEESTQEAIVYHRVA